MILYPTIELLQRRCVSLNRGQLGEQSTWHVDPVEKARGFAADGAEWMHVTDIDGLLGRQTNDDLLELIIRKAGIPVQLGGGFRTRDAVERWIDRGAGRIVLSTLAVQNPGLVKQIIKYHPDQIVLAVDIRKGRVMVDGWRQESAIAPADFIAAFDDLPLAGVLITDIDADMGEVDGQIGMIAGLAEGLRAHVIACGVVRSLDDVTRLKYAPGIDGAIVGRALFRRDLDLRQALEVARPTPEPVAGFL
jgi:phosphoribosylformimino-5-aminoimidazole carboxamide ribotide isomerase